MNKQNDLPVLLAFLPDKIHQQEIVDEVMIQLHDGNINPIDVELKLKALVNICKSILDNAHELICNEIDKYTEKTISIMGVEITKRTIREYDYESDRVWRDLKAIEKNDAEKRKAREKFLQSVKGEGLDPETGEIINEITHTEKPSWAVKF